MARITSALLGLFLLQSLSSASTHSHSSQTKWETAFRQFETKYIESTYHTVATSSNSCTTSSLTQRRSWEHLDQQEKQDYINAVKCLRQLPAKVDKSVAPGARNRADDFTYQHITQTNYIHVSGIFLPWHRQFVHAYEKALREECGYKGYQPYWDWLPYSDDQAKSPVFRSDAASFGGNGQYVAHGPTNQSLPGVPGPFYLTRDAGTGGGYIFDGAFKDLIVTLGPVVPGKTAKGDPYGLRGQPRRLKRDFRQSYSETGLTYHNATVLMQSVDYDGFHSLIDRPMHPSSHQWLGGDAYDFYSSPNDPVFYLLHAQIDRLWSIWQGQDYQKRKNEVGGTVTFMNLPPSRNATLDTVLNMTAILGGDITFGQAVSPVENDYCYVYV